MTDWTKGSHNWHVVTKGGEGVLCGADVPRSVVTKNVEVPAGDVCKRCWGELKQLENDARELTEQEQEDLKLAAEMRESERAKQEAKEADAHRIRKIKLCCDKVEGILTSVMNAAHCGDDVTIFNIAEHMDDGLDGPLMRFSVTIQIGSEL